MDEPMGIINRRRDDIEEVPNAELDELRLELASVRLELARARGAFDNLPIGVVMADASGAIIGKNQSARSVTSGGHSGVLVAEAVERQIEQVLQGRSGRTEVELFGPPKRVVQLHSTRLADGGVLVSIEDISERSRLDAVRTDFVANISHELKTPVGAIAVLAETIVDEDDLDVIHHLADRLVEEAHRAATSIDDLLELSRIELGGQAVRDRVSAASVLRDSVVRSLAAAEQRRIRLTLDEPSGEIWVKGDRRQLVSALSNLIDNAIKYSEAESEVRVSAPVADSSVHFTVADSGIGIPTRDLNRIIERFYRVDRARSRETGGSGLGLAIVRHVATNHEGEVTVSSAEGEGSVFTLSIPEAR